MIEHEIRRLLDSPGHDAEHVNLHDELEKGDDDRTLAAYSLETERSIVTYDSDWVEDVPEREYHCVLLFEDETLSAENVTRIAHRMSEAYPESEFRGLQKTGRSWL